MKSKRKLIILYIINFVIILISGYFIALPLTRSFENIFSTYPACSGRKDGFALHIQDVCSGDLLAISIFVSLLVVVILILLEIKLILKDNKKISSRISKDTILFCLISVFAIDTFVTIQNGFVPIPTFILGIFIFPFIFKELIRSIRSF